MAKKTLVHKGYHGSIEVDNSDYSLYGRILFIDEEISYRGESFSELESTFQNCVEKHIKEFTDNGKQPPFS